MKRILLILAVVAGVGATTLPLHSQAAAPAVAVPSGSALEQLKVLRDRNAKILEHQTTTIQKLDELEKTSQTVKVLGRRS
jgi:hypothetical protein